MSASPRWAVGVAGSATVLAAAGAAMLILFATELASRGLDWVPWTVSIGLAAPLLFAALAVLLRRHARLDARRAVLFTVLAVAACWAALAALLSWSAGFDAADEGRDASGSTRAALIAVVAAWLLGSAAVAALLAALLPLPGRTILRRALAVLIGCVGSLVIGAALVGPGPVLVASAALLVLAVADGRPGERAATRVAAPRVSSGTRGGWQHEPGASAAVGSAQLAGRAALSPLRARGAAGLAWAGAALGGAAAVFALTGSAWPGVALDATQAMQLGIAVGDLTGLLLVASVALLLERRVRRRLGVHVSAVLLAAALVLASAASLAGLPGSSDIQWELLLGSVLVASIALALAVYTLVPGQRATRATVAAACAIALPVTLGIGLLAAAAFLVPPAAVAWATWGVRALAPPRRDPAPALSPQS